MFLIGIVMVILGFALGISILWIIGLVLIVLGLVGNGYAHWGPAPGPGARRRYWY